MWIEIFKTGEHTDSAGRKSRFDTGSLDTIAEKYNTKAAGSDSFLAPLVKGHPDSDAPACGWVERLARRGDRLLARLKQLTPEIIEDVRKGSFRKVSVALYPDLMLRHVGLLGAASPAVKGLQNVSFAEGEDFRSFEAECQCNNDNEESQPEEAVPAEYEEMKKLREENSVLAERVELLEKEARLRDYRHFANSLLDRTEGSVISPAQVDDVIDILENAYCSASGESEGAANVDRLKQFISGIMPVALTGELISGGVAEAPLEDFTAKNVSPNRLDLHEKARGIQSKTPGLAYEEAVCMAIREK